MKKLLVLVAVLAMASSAWAGATLEISNPLPSYGPSDTILIELTATFHVCFFSIGSMWDGSTGTYSAVGIHAGFDKGIGGDPNPGEPGTEPGQVVKNVDGEDDDSTEPGVGDVTPGSIIWWIEYHVPNVDDSTIITLTTDGVNIADAYYMEYVTALPGIEIHVTPEPMTVALLGLGGLFLRRRK